MILTMDVGNTNIGIGLFDADGSLAHHWRVSTDRERTADELAVLLHNLFHTSNLTFDRVDGVVIGLVVPPLQTALAEVMERHFDTEPLWAGASLDTGVDIRIDNPQEAGADRIANAVGGFAGYGGPLVVVDFGTSTNLDAVSADGAYLGGAIAPGVNVAAEALWRRAAKLPRVEVRAPRHAIGRNTIDSMHSGILYGFAGQVDGLVRRFKQELTEGRDPGDTPKVVATGGLASVVAPHAEEVDCIDPLLTLRGLYLVYQRNA